MKHSTIVGGSTADRVVHCPGSVKLCGKMPRQKDSIYADRGTLCHTVITDVLMNDAKPETHLGKKLNKAVFDKDLLDKVYVAQDLLGEVDPRCEMDFVCETEVNFGDFLPGVFGSNDLLGRLADSCKIIDWKFGDGVIVDAEENYQMMFYAAAAMRTDSCLWAISGAKELELIIIQPPDIRRWTTTWDRIRQFETELEMAVKAASKPDAALMLGKWCRWCTAKPICPLQNGEVDRMLHQQLKVMTPDELSSALTKADLLENFIHDLRALAFQSLEAGLPVPGFKLVAKRANRKWSDDKKAEEFLVKHLTANETYTTEIISPAAAEKVLKKSKIELPEDLVVKESSGNTLAPESDNRPAVVQIGKQLTAALSKLQ